MQNAGQPLHSFDLYLLSLPQDVVATLPKCDLLVCDMNIHPDQAVVTCATYGPFSAH